MHSSASVGGVAFLEKIFTPIWSTVDENEKNLIRPTISEKTGDTDGEGDAHLYNSVGPVNQS